MLHAGDVVDRFEVVELLGVGGIAQVYKVRHRVLGSFHALKLVTAGGPAVARRLLREGSIQAQLRHPNVVAVTDVMEVRGHSALVLEYVEGITLQGLIAEKGALGLEESLALFSQVLAGVAAAHASGVLHRDLKPGNILLAPGPSGVLAKVTDFGLAKVLVGDVAEGPGDTIQGLVMGTPGYMAPEQAGGAAGADARADVFALGVVLYEMLTGIAPFTRDDLSATLTATLLGNHELLGSVDPTLPRPLVETVERCLSVDRLSRYTDAHELARALYGDRPDLAEVVAGNRAAAPLAISLPSLMPLRAAGVGSAASGAPLNATMAPAAFDYSLRGDAPSSAGATLAPGLELSEPIAAPAPFGAPTAPGSAVTPQAARGRVGWVVVAALVLVGGAGWWSGRTDPAGPAPSDQGQAAQPPTAALAPPGTMTPGDPLAGPSPVEPPPAGATTAGAASTGAAPGGIPPAEAPPTARAPGPTGNPPGASPAASLPPKAGGVPPPPGGAKVAAAAVAPIADVVEPLLVVAPSVDPAIEAAAAAKADADARTVTAIGRITGTWEGTWAGRPFTLLIDGRGGERLSGQLEVLVGTSYRTFRVGGALNSATGRFTLSEDATPGWWLDGVVEGAGLSGSIRHPEQKKATSYSARRR